MAASTAALLAALSGWKWNARGEAESSGIEGIQSEIQFLHLRWVKKKTKHRMMNFRYRYLSQSFHHMANSEPKMPPSSANPMEKRRSVFRLTILPTWKLSKDVRFHVPTFPVK